MLVHVQETSTIRPRDTLDTALSGNSMMQPLPWSILWTERLEAAIALTSSSAHKAAEKSQAGHHVQKLLEVDQLPVNSFGLLVGRCCKKPSAK